MNKLLLDALRCPCCSGEFRVIHETAESEGSEYAVLSCYCDQYPVVAGIPIIRKGVLGAGGESTSTISQFIMSGKYQDALLAMLMPPAPASANLAPAWLKALPQIKGLGRVRSVLGKPAIPRWTRFAREFLASGLQGKTVHDCLKFYFLQSGNPKEGYNYFVNRFGQPRQLVALSLMTIIEPPPGPVLDFGCGFGHLTSHLVRRVRSQPLFAADLSFTRLYIAKTFLAPAALYVCCNGDTSLPFIDQFFSVVYSSDTLYMVTNKVICSRELKRVVDNDGLIVIAGLRNGTFDPQRYPKSLPYHIYGQLFDSLPHRVLANTDVLARYVTKFGPTLSRSSEPQTLEREQWISIVATRREEVLVDRGSFADWPHAEGLLTLNPLYKPVEQTRNETDGILYLHTFPSSWYEVEDGDCRKYEPESVRVSSEILRDLSLRKRTPAMEDLIAHCVIVGVPEGFQEHH